VLLQEVEGGLPTWAIAERAAILGLLAEVGQHALGGGLVQLTHKPVADLRLPALAYAAVAQRADDLLDAGERRFGIDEFFSQLVDAPSRAAIRFDFC
jgi:hypothetical protein